MAVTQRSVEEAKAYIAESLKKWEEDNEFKKIISLAAFAEKWRSVTNAPLARMRILQKNIKALKLVIKRNATIGVETGNLEVEMEDREEELKALEEKYGEHKVKKAKRIDMSVK